MIIKSAGMALDQSEEALREIDWSSYGDILMIGKSIGTIAGSAYARRYGIDCCEIHFSPVEETFRFAGEKGIVFHGTADRWVDTEVVERCCAEKGLSLYKIEGANHSLEKGDVESDIDTIKKIMRIIREYVR
jgi:phosphoglycolate phosphatase